MNLYSSKTSSLLVVLSLVALVEYTTGDVVTFYFNITYGQLSPDNNWERRAILINGAFPGPTIRVNPNDQVVVYVYNNLDHGIGMHWHGIHQLTTKNADGAPNITQQPIEPGDSYIYNISINGQHGTFAYHLHSRLDMIWCYGVFIIEDAAILAPYPDYYYDDEFTVIFSQSWVTDIDDLYTLAPLIPPPVSILINGGFNPFYQVITVQPNKVYRVRFISLFDNSAAICTIEGHSLTIIEADGTITNLVQTDYLLINILQRYSVLLITNQTIGNYIIQCRQTQALGPGNGKIILHYVGANNTTQQTPGPELPNGQTTLTQWVLPQLQPSTIIQNQPLVYPCPTNYDVQLIIGHQFNQITRQFTINGDILVYPTNNYLDQYNNGVDISGPAIYTVNVGQKVQIVFQNRNLGVPLLTLDHPWHMHGHTFYVVGYGNKKYNPATDASVISNNIANGRVEFRDVVTLFNNGTSLGPGILDISGYTGWTAIRFIANNPGVWLVHCHITPHLVRGKVFMLHVKNV